MYAIVKVHFKEHFKIYSLIIERASRAAIYGNKPMGIVQHMCLYISAA